MPNIPKQFLNLFIIGIIIIFLMLQQVSLINNLNILIVTVGDCKISIYMFIDRIHRIVCVETAV